MQHADFQTSQVGPFLIQLQNKTCFGPRWPSCSARAPPKKGITCQPTATNQSVIVIPKKRHQQQLDRLQETAPPLLHLQQVNRLISLQSVIKCSESGWMIPLSPSPHTARRWDMTSPDSMVRLNDVRLNACVVEHALSMFNSAADGVSNHLTKKKPRAACPSVGRRP